MTLEEITAQLNGSTFWKEFTFSQNQFSPRSGQEAELADNIVWLGQTLFVIQMKEREQPTGDSEAEGRWFKNKIRGKAVSQIKDSLRFLAEHESICISNDRGHRFEISSKDFLQIEKIILYTDAPALPDECRAMLYHISETAGFIHLFEQANYSQVVKTLAVPEEVRRYLGYRRNALNACTDANIKVVEADLLAAYMSDEVVPTPTSHRLLDRLFDDSHQTDLSPIMNRLADHIQHPDSSDDYTRILLEFAKLPRSAWRAAKERLDLAIAQARNGEFKRPYYFAFPPTDCCFMFSPIPSERPSTGLEGERTRVTGLSNLTAIAKYLLKTSKGVGVLVSKDGDHFHLDWCLIDQAWEYDPDLDAHLEKSNPFGAVGEKKIDGFYFFDS
ncbi:hypothetical protein [Roseibium algae]|uniref:CD-NTase associated protein 4-like DNA endonuclease domain-containing protein n=1 Tax=Roseibium algae TaxID=3123038 RepID=A0ABU8TPS2_9HYPH